MVDRERDRAITLAPGHTLRTTLGINGCAAGSGKTRAMLALVHADLQRPHLEHGTIPTRVISCGALAHHEVHLLPAAIHGTTIVLASPSVRTQWLAELGAAGGEGTPLLRHTLLDNVRRLATFVPAEHDVAIVSETVYRKLAEMRCHWRRLIYDEADSYLFTGMRMLSTSFTWLVTATWDTLERFTAQQRRRRRGPPVPRHAMQCILEGMDLASIVVGAGEVGVAGLPDPVTHEHVCRRPVSIVDAVAGHIGGEVLAQVRAGDVQGAIRALGGTVAGETSIVDVVRRRLSRSLEEARFRAGRSAAGTAARDEWDRRVDQLAGDLRRVDERFASILQEDTCAVCMDAFQSPVLTPCHHVFCTRCIVPWLQQSLTCPQCRAPVPPGGLVALPAAGSPLPQPPPSPPVEETPCPTRMDHLVRLIHTDRRPDQRIIVFSEHDASLETIKTVLPAGTYGMLRGHRTTRDRAVQQFRDGTAPVLLLNSRINGAGVDLPCTTDIVLFHGMPASLELQAVARGQRLGRTAPLHIHRFVDQPQ